MLRLRGIRGFAAAVAAMVALPCAVALASGSGRGGHGPSRPWVTTLSPRQITSTTANVRGGLNPVGRRVTYWFQYGPTRRYGKHTRSRTTRSLRRLLAIKTTLRKLAPGRTYHYRLVASTCRGCRRGTAYGRDGMLRTPPTPPRPQSSPSRAPTYYTNPVYRQDAPDPSVLDLGGAHRDYWAYTTGDRFPVLHSSDLVHWSSRGMAFSARPSWATSAPDWHPWSPHVVQAPESCPGTSSGSCYVMYYTTLSGTYNFNCVGVATSTTPGGPFTDQGPLSNGTPDHEGRPIGCGDDNGYGMIDPSLFIDPASGQAFLYGSEDFACPAGSSSCTSANSTLAPTISVIPISSDLLHATGPRTPLFTGQAGTWEADSGVVPTVEGPGMIYHRGLYYLMYSGGNWRARYGVGVAVSTSPNGPFTKNPGNPIMASSPSVLSVGGGEAPVTGPHGGLWYVYHGRTGNLSAPRSLRIDPFSWQPVSPSVDMPAIAGPTSTAQPWQP